MVKGYTIPKDVQAAYLAGEEAGMQICTFPLKAQMEILTRFLLRGYMTLSLKDLWKNPNDRKVYASKYGCIDGLTGMFNPCVHDFVHYEGRGSFTRKIV